MIPLAALLTLSIGGSDSTVAPAFECDMLEVNHVYSRGTGMYRFSQVIAWDMVEGGHWKVQGWATIDRDQCADIWAVAKRTKRAQFRDKDGRSLLILFKAFRQTRTAYDPEVENREHFPSRSRRGLPKASKTN